MQKRVSAPAGPAFKEPPVRTDKGGPNDNPNSCLSAILANY